MVDALYAVKSETYHEWPFALFKDLSGAVECVTAMHPDRDSDDLSMLIYRVPAFKSYSLVDAGDALRCSQEVL